MTADLFVVHLVSRGVAGAHSGWDTPNGTVHHEVVAWSRSPASLSEADVVVAHGLAALVVAQAIVGVGPCLVYRPVGATRANRRRLQRAAARDLDRRSEPAYRSCHRLRAGTRPRSLTVFRSDDRAVMGALTAELFERGPAASNLSESPVEGRSRSPWCRRRGASSASPSGGRRRPCPLPPTPMRAEARWRRSRNQAPNRPRSRIRCRPDRPPRRKSRSRSRRRRRRAITSAPVSPDALDAPSPPRARARPVRRASPWARSTPRPRASPGGDTGGSTFRPVPSSKA